jgi:hypothetical protein
LQIKTKIVSCHTANSKAVKQEVNGTVILDTSPFSIPCLKVDFSLGLTETCTIKLFTVIIYGFSSSLASLSSLV